MGLDVFTDFCSSHRLSLGVFSAPPPPSLGDTSFTVCSLESIITSKHSFSLSISRSSGHREAEGKCAYFTEGDAEAQGDREVGRLGGPRSWIF